ncbi:MAG: hypothetical protein KVP17_000276 [Porospora cf. gigantea B]|uniref:uncharacterized protein n=1 Tax=Porospora cf. gigantea B TaxID=2853592 RepID=UPI0035719F4A|nr:MAG: hypothetical protein KVP17_000276 [Porospora cf. gigantea B]
MSALLSSDLDWGQPSTYPDWLWTTIVIGSILLVLFVICCVYLCLMPYITCCKCCKRCMNVLCLPFQCVFKCCRHCKDRHKEKKQKKQAKEAKEATKELAKQKKEAQNKV